MLLPDGRLGIVDFGQAKRLTREQRLAVARQVVAVASGDDDGLLEQIQKTKFRTKGNDPKALVKYTKLVWQGSLVELGRLAESHPVGLAQAQTCALTSVPAGRAIQWV